MYDYKSISVRKCSTNNTRCTMKPESKFWNLIKKNTPKIQWTRLESWASFGVPDLLGYNDSCGFFMVEMKVARGPKSLLVHTKSSSTLLVQNVTLY